MRTLADLRSAIAIGEALMCDVHPTRRAVFFCADNCKNLRCTDCCPRGLCCGTPTRSLGALALEGDKNDPRN